MAPTEVAQASAITRPLVAAKLKKSSLDKTPAACRAAYSPKLCPPTMTGFSSSLAAKSIKPVSTAPIAGWAIRVSISCL